MNEDERAAKNFQWITDWYDRMSGPERYLMNCPDIGAGVMQRDLAQMARVMIEADNADSRYVAVPRMLALRLFEALVAIDNITRSDEALIDVVDEILEQPFQPDLFGNRDDAQHPQYGPD